jgi:hypothetical protein
MEYRCAMQLAAAANAAPYLEIRTGANACRVLSVLVSQRAATAASEVDFYRVLNGASGAGGTVGSGGTGFTPQSEAVNAASPTTQVITSWSGGTAPTIGSVTPHDGIRLPAADGSTMIFQFPKPLELPPNSCVIMWNRGGATSVATRATVVIEE